LQLPPPPILSQVRTSPRLAHYYDRGLVCPRGQFHWNYVTKASSPFFPPNQWRSLVSVVVKPTSNVDLGATVIHAVGARSIIFIVFFIHRCRPPPSISRHRSRTPHRRNPPVPQGHIHSRPTPTPPTVPCLGLAGPSRLSNLDKSERKVKGRFKIYKNILKIYAKILSIFY
jgi:hypothetical protein